MNIGKVCRFAVSLPKTIYVNFKTLPWAQAIKLPILVDVRTKIRGGRKGSIKIEAECRPFMIKFGFQPGTEGVPQLYNSNCLVFGSSGVLKFCGGAKFARGIHIRVGNGEIEFGENFTCNKSCFFTAKKKIKFGKNVLIGWNTNIRDMDGHDIWIKEDEEERIINYEQPITIGDNVWIAACVDVFKGANIPSGNIVGYRAGVFGAFDKENSVLAGFPAKVIKQDVCWK